MKLKPYKKKAPFSLLLWRSISHIPPKTDKKGQPIPIMRAMRGNARARIVLIAPPCTPLEYEEQKPFIDNGALEFHQILDEHADLDTNSDCLVVSCSLFGEKANKASTDPIRGYLEKLAKRDQFTFFICVGDDAFKFMFGRGKKPSMGTLAGNIMYVPETNFKPLYVFPNLEGLSIESEDAEKASAYELRRTLDWQDKTIRRFITLATNLRKLAPGT